jgi:hypothetical protein
MNLKIIAGSNAPDPTNVITGFITTTPSEPKSLNLDVTTLSVGDQQIVTDYFAIVGFHLCTNVINTSQMMDLNMTVPVAVDDQALEYDYTALTGPQQASVDSFEALILANAV